MYRWIYRGVDLVTVFSANQVEVLGGRLGIDRVAVIPFGVDVDELLAIPTAAGGPPVVLAVGRDAGRDWPTLLAAVTGTGWNVELVTRRRQIDGLVVPTEVTLVGTEPRPDYLRRLAAATVVVIPSHELAYPSGQTVLLEALALGTACVVTTTQALADYTRPGRDCVGVPVGDAAALRRAVSELLGDATLRDQLGREAAAIVRSNFSATQMWAAVADRVRAMLDE